MNSRCFHDSTVWSSVSFAAALGCSMNRATQDGVEYATRNVDSISPDPATEDVLARWTDVLMKLESDPMQLSRELDWVIKKAWIDQFMDRDWLAWRNPKVSLLDLQYHDIR